MNFSKINTIKITIYIIISLIIISSCYGCRHKYEDKYGEQLILGKTEDVYVREIESLLIKIYSEDDIRNKQVLKDDAFKYMTEECAELMTHGNEREGVRVSKGKCGVKQISFAYGQHQDDGRSKILAHLIVKIEGAERHITLEMRLNNEDKIYEIIVW